MDGNHTFMLRRGDDVRIFRLVSSYPWRMHFQGAETVCLQLVAGHLAAASHDACVPFARENPQGMGLAWAVQIFS